MNYRPPARYLRHRPPPGPARSAASASHSGSPERCRAPVVSRFLPRPPCRPACPVSPLRLGCSSAAAAPSLPNGQCICHLQLYAGRRRETRICLALFVAADEEERHAFFLAPRRHQQSITNDPSTDSPELSSLKTCKEDGTASPRPQAAQRMDLGARQRGVGGEVLEEGLRGLAGGVVRHVSIQAVAVGLEHLLLKSRVQQVLASSEQEN